MATLIAIFAAVFGPTFLAVPAVGDGWYWDAGNALGFAAFAGLICLALPGAGRINLRAHQALGYSVLLIALAHAFWFLLGDGAVVEFLKFGAPDYMWLGVAAVLMLGVLVCIALVPDRFRIHADYPAFRYWHRVLAVATIAAAGYHIVVSGFYLASWLPALIFVAGTTALLVSARVRERLRRKAVVTYAHYLLASVVASALFAAIRNIAA